jgi:metallo-beta-lactamase family protein
VRISGEDVAVRASIRSLDCYSAHADRSDLLAWIRARKPIKGSLFLVHGEEEGMAAMAASLEEEIASIIRPQIGDVFRMEPSKPAHQQLSGPAAINAAVAGDWQNAYAKFEVDLKSNLERITGDERRRDAIARMRAILSEAAAATLPHPERTEHESSSNF